MIDISTRLRRMRGPHWLALFALSLAGWTYIFAMQLPGDLRLAADTFGADLWAAICGVEPGTAGAPAIFLMWAAMTAAMMAPSFLPTLATYDDLVQGGAAHGFTRLLAGYLSIWLGFAALATAFQLGLARLDLLDPMGASASRWLNVVLLAGAGAYQFSALKDSCLSKCRHPMTFFMQHWDEGPWRMGLRLGALCLGCCWALMALAFVGGTMNLVWMGAAMVLMTLEKLPEIGRWLTKPLGLALITAALVTAAT